MTFFDFLSTASPEKLRRRAELLKELRMFFDSRGFFEVQTPILSHDVLIDRHIEPIEVTYSGETLFLQTSPEFAMKRLLASGCERIYQITPAFRRGDRGDGHNVEFTLLEWYRVGDGYREGRAFLSDLAEAVLGRGPANGRTFEDVFIENLGLNPHTADTDSLRGAADRFAKAYPESFLDSDAPASRGDWLDFLFTETIQPKLGRDTPTIVYDYPALDAQLARTRAVVFADGQNGHVAERFELFVDGVELANGYHELTDANELRRRFEETARQRRWSGQKELPTQSRLLTAMENGLPPSSGCALGVDRLLMIRLGAARIDEVIAFPIERA